ncbi:MAG: serine/threonine protein kinase [Lysobacteraceae bacterium]|nr:MAG: serine/threonine protein kinase [Xanthomonadaceae bacterium]
MQADTWQRVRDLFERASDVPAGERDAFLDRACAGDPELRREVDALLRSDAASGATAGLAAELPDLVDAIDAEARDKERAQLAGRRLGAWRLLREIGRGGMGAVWLAERADGAYAQQAAVKLVRGGWDAQALLHRFRAERQILATLNHPNIAHLVDGGVTDDGKPYLVLEYVDGTLIGEHCDERRLGIAPRLDLFLSVCDAVAHAHRSLVVHRDLKPSNILVDRNGQVKLLDFGIAKLLESDAGATATAMRAFTPEYAAPEQIQGRPVTTGVDVHALGLLLYELLTGRRPYRGTASTPAAYEQAILTEEPPRPSRMACEDGQEAVAFAQARNLQPSGLRARLRGDLDAIVLKALRKEPAQRYASVEAMADDVRAYIAQAPVKARRGNFSYRVTRFLQRHALAAGLALAALASLVGGLGAALWQAERARAQRDVAEAEARKSGAVVEFLTRVFSEAEPGANDGKEPSASELLARGIARIDEQTDLDPATRAALLVAMGRAHSRLGDGGFVQDLMRRALASAQASGDVRAEIDTRIALASALSTNSRYEDTLAEYGEVRRMIVDHGIDDPLLLARVDSSTGIALGNLDRNAEAWPYLERALAVRRHHLGPLSDDVAHMLPVTAVTLKALDRPADALPLIEPSYRAAQSATDLPLARKAMIIHAYSLAMGHAKRYAEAEQLCREALQAIEQVYGKGDARTVSALISWGVSLRNLERHAESARVMEDVLAVLRAHLPADHRRVADALVNAGASRTLAGEPARAIGHLEEALAICERRNERDGRTAARATVALAKALEEQGDIARALEQSTRAQPFTTGERAHFGGAAAAAPRLQHARLLLRSGAMPADCAPILEVLAIDGIADAARIEATVLAAACEADQGRLAQARTRLANLRAGDGGDADISRYAAERLRQLEGL